MASLFRGLAENWKLKALAFALAVLLWIVVSAEQVTSNWMFVPVTVEVADPNFQAISSDLQQVEVRFSGAARELLDIAVARPPLRLTVNQVRQETEVFELHPRMVQIPGQIGVSALEVRPSRVTLQFGRLDSRTVPVRARIENNLGEEWAITERLTVEPEQVLVSGPAARVAGVSEVMTRPIEVPLEQGPFEVNAVIDTAGLQGLSVSTRTVTISGRVDRLVERVVEGVAIDVGPGVRIAPERVSVVLQGPATRVEQAISAGFRVAIAIDEIPTQLPPEGAEVPVRIDRLPTGVSGEASPRTITLTPLPPSPPPADTLPVGPQLDTIPAAAPGDGV